MEDYLNELASIINSKLDETLYQNKAIGIIWDFDTKMINDNNIIVSIEDNRKEKHKFKINIERL